jgi:hypothetical protein
MVRGILPYVVDTDYIVRKKCGIKMKTLWEIVKISSVSKQK